MASYSSEFHHLKAPNSSAHTRHSYRSDSSDDQAQQQQASGHLEYQEPLKLGRDVLILHTDLISEEWRTTKMLGSLLGDTGCRTITHSRNGIVS